MKKTSIQPLGDRVLIEPLRDHKEGKTEFGIYLPETVEKERPEKGKIIAVGIGRVDEHGKKIPMHVKKGDIVIFSKYQPQEVNVDGKEYLIAKEEDILAIVN